MTNPTQYPQPLANPGTLFVLSGASGVGKGSMLKWVLAEERKRLWFSVSWTTRSQRPGEVEGVDYFFKTTDGFVAELEDPKGGFLEHAEFVGHRYGTPRRPIAERLAAGQDVILDIELQGAMQVRALMPEAILILVVPPNLSILRHRLLKRGTEALDVIERRIGRAERDIGRAHEFHYVIVNDTLSTAVDDLQAIIRAERLRASKRSEADLRRFSSTDPEFEPEVKRIEAVIRQSGV
jgi:guanylate kinase